MIEIRPRVEWFCQLSCLIDIFRFNHTTFNGGDRAKQTMMIISAHDHVSSQIQHSQKKQPTVETVGGLIFTCMHHVCMYVC